MDYLEKIFKETRGYIEILKYLKEKILDLKYNGYNNELKKEIDGFEKTLEDLKNKYLKVYYKKIRELIDILDELGELPK